MTIETAVETNESAAAVVAAPAPVAVTVPAQRCHFPAKLALVFAHH